MVMNAMTSSDFDFGLLKALVVGDDLFERGLVVAHLRAIGVEEIETTETAVDAFARLPRSRPTLILADAEMAPHTGIDFVREVRRNGKRSAETPILLFTSETSAGFAHAAFEAGANGVLPKPLSNAALAAEVRAVFIGAPRAATPAEEDDAPKLPSINLRRSNPSGGMSRADRHAVSERIDAAATHCAAWLSAGARDALSALKGELLTAMSLVHGDPALARGLAAALRMADAAAADGESWNAALAACRAILAAGPERAAMRQALADAAAALAARSGRTP
jgi:CheY-like chemotaxis protein